MPTTFAQLKRFWHVEILDAKKRFSWWRLLRRARRSNSSRCLFWLRLSQYLYSLPYRGTRSLGKQINKSLTRTFGVEVMLGAQIDEGLSLGHPTAIIIYSGVRIGKNCCIRQCTTIGSIEKGNRPITLGDNVDIGAHTCIIGSGLVIGSNVRIGAMSFVNKDIPDDVTYITRKDSFTRPNNYSAD